MTAKGDAQLRAEDLKNCVDIPSFGRTLDIGELAYHDGGDDEKESLTKFKKWDHEEHDLLIEEHLLYSDGGRSWKQIGRWIKYEESLEENGSRWGKPHVPALSFHSIINLRRVLEAGQLILDCEDRDFESLTQTILLSLSSNLHPGDLSIVEECLLSKHTHVNDSEKIWNKLNKELNKEGGGTVSTMELGMSSLALPAEELRALDRMSRLLRSISRSSEGALVLVGQDSSLQGLSVVFVRLAEGIIMPNVTEVPIPARFLFLLLGPPTCELDYVEVGRCMGVLLSNSIFRHIAYQARELNKLLVGLNEFLDVGILLPHGNWDHDRVLYLKIEEQGQQNYERKMRMGSLTVTDDLKAFTTLEDPLNPFRRTRKPFGGMINDIKRRYPLYWSDIKDAFNIQCFATIIFLYFACVSGGIALGQVLKTTTNDYIGIQETLLGTAVGGVIFAVFAAQPLVIMSATGPTLVFDASLYAFCKSQNMETNFLALRFWIGIWMALIGLIVVGAEGSVVVRFVSRFTQEIFATFISIFFIFESFKSSLKCFKELVTDDDKIITAACVSGEFFTDLGLMMLTFTIAWIFRSFKTSNYGTKLTRKLLGNFGVFLTIIAVSGFAYLLTPFNPRLKNLDLPDALEKGFTPTIDNTTGRFNVWLVDPNILPVKWIFGAIVPALLLFLLIFLELSIGELIMSRKENLTKKGTGFHLDVLLLCFINVLMGFLGCTWVSSATVRGVTHIVALTMYSTDNAPGEKPTIIGTREQRVTAFVVSILVGCSVLIGTVLQYVPMSVIMGIFLYMGVSALSGIQFMARIQLFFMQVHKYPEVPYTKKVRTWKMHVYTLIQIVSVAVIWGIKVTPAALVLPCMFVFLIPIRKFLLIRFYDDTELEALDGVGGNPLPPKEPLKVDVPITPTDSKISKMTTIATEKTIKFPSISLQETDKSK